MKQCKATCGSTKCALKKSHKKAHQNTDGSIKWENTGSDVQGFKPLLAHTPREDASNFYSTGETPKGYKCSQCSAKGCKLWRQSNTMASALELMCGPCALKDQKITGEIDANGKVYDKSVGMDCDQIGWLLPAVPCENEDTYWGYSSVPQDGVNWWRNLPSKP
jgi:hypothetical protein